MPNLTRRSFVAAALAPAEVYSAVMLEDGRSCRVIVPDDQLTNAIGTGGQNARLAARLTGYRIDIKSLSQMDSAAGAEEAEIIFDEEDEDDELIFVMDDDE